MRLLILSASTGGGHDMRAYALQDWWNNKGGVSQVDHPLENTFWGYKAGCQFYNFIQKKIPWFHKVYFNFLEYASIHRFPETIIGAKKFSQRVSAFRPDVIVSTHAHLNHGYFDLSRKSSQKPPGFVVYCGELADGNGFSRHWVNPDNDLFVAPFEEGCTAAEKRGMPDKKILKGGPLLRRDFYRQYPTSFREEVLNRFGLKPNKPIYLLGTGANGVNHHSAIINALNKARIDCQIIALCGRNKKTFEQVKNISWNSYNRVVVLPNLDASTMVDLLMVATWMLARPGAGLTTEAAVTGCPLIFDLSGGCMPQESNNLNFFKNRIGKLLTSSSASQLIELIKNEKDVPRLHLPLEDSPHILLNALSSLVERN